MVALALITAAYILQADFDRRGFKADAFLMITVAGLAGIIGAKLYHLLEDPGTFFADPWPLLFSRYGFAWFGGFLGGFGAMLLMGWRAKLPMLEFLDACSPAASFGYAIGRIGCFLSGDGDYGRPTIATVGHEFSERRCTDDAYLRAMGMARRLSCASHTALRIDCVDAPSRAFLWHMGSKAVQRPESPRGNFLHVPDPHWARHGFWWRLSRINPPWFFGMSNAQAGKCGVHPCRRGVSLAY